MLTENASVLVGHCHDFILANKHACSSHCVRFNSRGDLRHVSKDAVFEVSDHSFVVGNGPGQTLSREVGMNTVGE